VATLVFAVIAVATSVAAVAPAVASTAAPDAHDRALVTALVSDVATFRAIDTAGFGASESRALRSCTPLLERVRAHEKNMGTAFASLLTAGFDLSVPLMIELADANDAKLLALEYRLEGMHPHAALFVRWRRDELAALGLIVAFDSHRTPVDACTAATYMVSLGTLTKAKQAAALASFHSEIGISADTFAALARKLFSNNDPAELLSTIELRMTAFFIAAGASSSDAAALSSSE
jgi:hypothetical protein